MITLILQFTVVFYPKNCLLENKMTYFQQKAKKDVTYNSYPGPIL
jgi:hypothetical protein